MAFIDKVKAGIERLEERLHITKKASVQVRLKHSHTDLGDVCHELHTGTENRFHSFAPQRHGNEAKFFVDGCGYFWAVSIALEEAKESIWILDWWLSPELYLRRPPSANAQYRLDRMLFAAADRGVDINIIVYKEVPSVLTLDSEHTQKVLELPSHPKIKLFRHPEHLLDGEILEAAVLEDLKKIALKGLDICQLPEESLKRLYGFSNDAILYWAHHEKLLLVDGKLAFMGGLDLCFGRWDTHQHSIADSHPSNVDAGLFPGQDYNNARIYDFENVTQYDKNKLDRNISSRIGWSDLSFCIQGPMVEDLRAHFVQRWNYIYKETYITDSKYQALSLTPAQIPDGYYKLNGHISNVAKGASTKHNWFHLPLRRGTMSKQILAAMPGQDTSGISIQLVRSCTEWSNGVPTEHSIANAYIQVIHDSQHYVYIENQFFITATSDSQHPVKNKIGAAIVERILRAHKNDERYKMIICIPAVPGFAGDLHSDDALGTRAIMEFQYNSICRGDTSILGALKKAGVPDPSIYIRFYNLRNYDRINANEMMAKIEKASHVNYKDAQMEHDDIVGAGYGGKGYETGAVEGQPNANLDKYQEAASEVTSKDGTKYDSVSACYMENGPSIKDIPWSGSEEDEMNAFVSEELYIHTKLLIADDRVVICGSANLNDRSQLGYHDSEIAVVVEDSTLVDSKMNGQPFKAAQFATSLRREIFRKHLGLLPPQDWTKSTANFLPVNKGPNTYDWNSASDVLVQDPLSTGFESLWNSTAKTNTDIFAKAFHCVPDDRVRNWDQYKEFYSKYFVTPDKHGKYTLSAGKGKYQYGHIVREEFPGGVRELKESLDRVRGTLVEMPLNFMLDVDFAHGLALNALTEPIYT